MAMGQRPPRRRFLTNEEWARIKDRPTPGTLEHERQRQMIREAGGWFAYFKGQRRQREQAQAEASEK